MQFIKDTTEETIFNHLMSRETSFTVRCIEFKEKVIIGTEKNRERKCRVRAKHLTKLVEEC